MFAIYKGRLHIADTGLDYSHAEWFKRLGWLDESNDSLMSQIVRGYVKDGAIFFYIGYDFVINDTVIDTMRSHIKELAATLGLSESTQVNGGAIISHDGKATPRIDLGTISDFLSATIEI